MDLLDGVNRVLVRTGTIKSTNKLTSLTDSANQMFIDTAVDCWNEVIDELYSLREEPRPKGIRTGNVILVDGQREYGLHSTLVTLRFDFHLIDETNSHTITLVPDAYRNIVLGDLEQDDTGLPSYATISPINGMLVFDRIPDSASAGRTYKYRYEHDLELDDATDCFPFTDTVARALVPAVAEKWKFEHKKQGSEKQFRKYLAQGARRLRRSQERSSWAPRHVGSNQTDPFNAANVH